MKLGNETPDKDPDLNLVDCSPMIAETQQKILAGIKEDNCRICVLVFETKS